MSARPPHRVGPSPTVERVVFFAVVLGLVALFLVPTSVVGAPTRTTASHPSTVTASAHPAAAPTKPVAWTDITSIAGTPPSARWLGAMTWDPVDNYVLLFGGYGPTGTTFSVDSDTWGFANGHWTEISTSGPAGRYAAMMTWDPADGYAVLFGGTTSGANVFNDTWTYVHGTWTNITGTTNQTPTGRWRASMVYDPTDGYVLMFGGTNPSGSSVYSDTWAFHAGKWRLLNVSGAPPGRYRASMAWDAANGYAVLFGGCTSTCPDSSTWKYVGGNWTALSPSTHPSARIYYGLTYSPIAQSVLFFGGSTGVTNTPASDTWNFSNGNWTSLTGSLTKSPTAVSYLMMAFDPTDNYTIMYGGQWANSTYSNRTWVLGPSVIGRLTVAPNAIDLHQNFTLNATPFGFSKYVNYSYPALPPGCSGGNVSTITCVPTATGTFPISVSVNDSLGVPAWENSSVTVAADPKVTAFSVDHPSITEGSKATFNVTVGGGTSPYAYRYSGLPGGCGGSNTATLPCVPTGTGSYTVEVNVTDGTRYSAYANVSITVNAKPNVTALQTLPLSLDVGQLLTMRATEVGGTGPITYVWSSLPAGCPSQDLAVLTCHPTGAFNSLVTVNATDADGWNASASAALIVNPDPTISATAAAPSAFDVGATVRIWTNVTGGTGAISYAYTNAPVGCTLAGAASTSCTPLVAGNATINVSATDAAGFTVNGTITFVVNPSLTASVSPSSLGVDLGQNITLAAVPLGGTAPYTYSFRSIPSGCPANPSSGVVACTPRTAGTFDVTVTVADASIGRTTATGQLVVHADPAVSSLWVSSGSPTVGSRFQLTTNVSGGSGAYKYVYAGLPTGCATQNASTISCTPSATGTFDVQVTVTDSLGKSSSGAMNVTVASKSSSSSILGLSSTTFYGLVAGVVLVVVVAAVALLMLRRRGPRPAKPSEATAEEPPGTEDEAPPS